MDRRLDKIAAALGRVDEPGILFVYVALDDGVPRTAQGEAVDRTAIDPATQVFVYAEVAAGSRPAVAGPHPERR